MESNEEINSKDVIYGSGTYNDAVYLIAQSLVGNGFDNEEKKRIAIDEKEQELREKISQICKIIESNHPDTGITESLEYRIVAALARRIERGENFDEISPTDGVAEAIYLTDIKPLEQRNMKAEAVTDLNGAVSIVMTQELLDKFNEELEKNGEKLEVKDDVKIVTRTDSYSNFEYKVFVEKPSDIKYECKNEEEEIREGQIEARKYNIKDIIKEAMSSKDEMDFVKRVHDIAVIEDGFGADALLRAVDELLLEYDSQLLESPVGSQLIDLLNNQLRESNISEDKYTEATKISILTSAITRGGNIQESGDLENALKLLDPELFSLIESNPALFKFIQGEFLENNESILSEIRQSCKGESKEEFIDALRDFISRPKDFITENGIALSEEQFIKLDEAQKGIIPSIEQTSEIFVSEKSEDTSVEKEPVSVDDDKFKQNIERLISDPVRGMSAIPTILESQADDSIKDYIENAILEKIEQSELKNSSTPAIKEKKERLFRTILERQRTNGEEIDRKLVDRLAEIDLVSLKEVLKYYIEIQNSGKGDVSHSDTISAISQSIKDKVATKETASPVVKEEQGSSIFDVNAATEAFYKKPDDDIGGDGREF